MLGDVSTIQELSQVGRAPSGLRMLPDSAAAGAACCAPTDDISTFCRVELRRQVRASSELAVIGGISARHEAGFARYNDRSGDGRREKLAEFLAVQECEEDDFGGQDCERDEP